MNEDERQNDGLSRQSPDDELGGDESSGGQPGDERSLLTAYALGELDDTRRAEIDARLRQAPDERQAPVEQAPDERQEVDDLTRLGKLLRSVAAQTSAGQSSSTQAERSSELREALIARLAGMPESQGPLRLPTAERFSRRRFWLPLSLAAALAVACGTLFTLMKTKHGEQVATRRTADASRGTEAAGLDRIADLSELETADESRARGLGRELQHGRESAELRAGDGEAVYFELAPAGAEPERQKGRGGSPNSPMSAPTDQAARPNVSGGLGAPGGGPTVDFAGATPRLTESARDGGGYGESGGGGQAEQKKAVQPATGLATTSPNPQPGLGWQGRGGRNAGGEDGAKQSPRIIVQEEETAILNASGKSGEGQYWFYQHGTKPGAAAGGDVGMDGMMAEGRGLPATSPAGRPYHFFTPASGPNTESYPALVETPFRKPSEYPLSTFSIDVDTASYTNVRRFLNSRAMPPRNAVRIEELINYFQYTYPQPEGDVPFSITTDVADCPWQAQHRLLRVGLKGREIPADQRPASNLVFLLDVSGSMDAPNKLPLVKEAMSLLVDKLTENDRVAIVVYAGNSGLVLPPTNGQNKETIRAAISRLVAGGSTNGGQGLQMAYDTAQAHFIKGGTNRVILATDGDFNVGVVDQNDLVRLIEEKARTGVFLSALGFGIGNLKDGTLEKLADKGNGNYAYIDTVGEARRVLVEQLSGTLVTIAKDVKLQIEFNPAQAAEYRLIGYEDRLMPDQDFHDDRKDAGEIGAGHSVTALYEIVPAVTVLAAGVEPLKYQRSKTANSADPSLTAAAATGELATIKLRYKQPDGEQSRLIEQVVSDQRPPRAEATQDMNFAAAVAAFGMLLRESPYRGDASFQKVLALAEQGLAGDATGYRSEFVQLVRQAKEISGKE